MQCIFGDKKLEKGLLELYRWQHEKHLLGRKISMTSAKRRWRVLLKLERIRISEVELFHAVLEWSKYQCAKKKNGANKRKQKVL